MSYNIQRMAQDFGKSSLKEIATSAFLRAEILRIEEPRPWKRSTKINDAIDNFRQLAAYCDRVIAMMDEAP